MTDAGHIRRLTLDEHKLIGRVGGQMFSAPYSLATSHPRSVSLQPQWHCSGSLSVPTQKGVLHVQAEQETHGADLPGGQPHWSPGAIKGLVGVSGVYNCADLTAHFDSRGLHKSLYEKIMTLDGTPQLKLLSPTYCVKVSHAPLG